MTRARRDKDEGEQGMGKQMLNVRLNRRHN